MSKLKTLEEILRQGKITRREFIARISALGLMTSVSPTLLAASATAATPKKGGRLRIGQSGASNSDTLDPAMISGMMQLQVAWQVCNCLVEIDHNGQLQPELAESWESSPDATKWIFNLRKGIEFHNGKTMDADDVLFSIKRHRVKESKSPAKSVLKPIKDLKKDGKHQLIFTLEEGNADFPFFLSDFHIMITPNGTTHFDKGIGTGGYSLVSFEPGVHAITKRNPNYWKEGRANFDEVETIGMNDVISRTNALKNGSIDLMDRCEKKTYNLMKRLPNIQGIETTGYKHYTYAMLTDRPPFNDNNMRLAAKYAIDRELILKIVLQGYGILGNDHPIAPANRYHNNTLQQRKYDPDKAKYYLKKAGFDKHTLKLHVSDEGFPGSVDAGMIYKNSATKANIDIDLVREPADGYWSNVWMKKTWCAVYWGGRPIEDWMLTQVYATGASWNDTKWKNDRFNKLLREARVELDEPKRREMYYEMQQILHNEGGVLVLAFVSDLAAASSKLKFGKLAANWELDGMKAAERWWYA